MPPKAKGLAKARAFVRLLDPLLSAPGLDVLRQYRADRSMPWLRKEVDWVYIDDFELAELLGPDELHRVGTVGPLQQSVRDVYRWWGAPRSEAKTTCRQLLDVQLRMQVDGSPN
eukprot:4003147-Amphidinium_carterae.1